MRLGDPLWYHFERENPFVISVCRMNPASPPSKEFQRAHVRNLVKTETNPKFLPHHQSRRLPPTHMDSHLSFVRPDEHLAILRQRSAETVVLARTITTFLRNYETGAFLNIHVYFALLYLHTTEAWHNQAALSQHPAFFYRLVPIFYDYYLSSVIYRLIGRNDARFTHLWDDYFVATGAAKTRGLRTVLKILFLGVRAHILADLPTAITQALAKSGLSSKTGLEGPFLRREFLGASSTKVFSKAFLQFACDLKSVLPPMGRRSRLGFTLINTPVFVFLSVLYIQHWRYFAWWQSSRLHQNPLGTKILVSEEYPVDTTKAQGRQPTGPI